jgi:hypothetical protein
VEHCLHIEKRFFGLEMNDVKRLAYLLAHRNNMQNTFSKANEKVERKNY